MVAIVDVALHDRPDRVLETTAGLLGYSASPACASRSIISKKRQLVNGVFTFGGDVDILLTLGQYVECIFVGYVVWTVGGG
jgi:hypothetical protein